METPKWRKFIKKQWSNILFFLFVLLLLIPQTRMPIQVFLNRTFAFSPSVTEASKREKITTYEWFLSDLDNQVMDFSSSQGKPIFVSFWATWCPPCIAEMPSIQEFYEKYGEEVDFYLVARDASSSVEAFLNKNSYTFPVYFEASPTPHLLDSNALPTSFLIHPNGEIMIKKTGAADWASASFFEEMDNLITN